MKPLILNLFRDNEMLELVMNQADIEEAQFIFRCFPDGETYIQFETSLKDRELIILASLDKPDPKFLPLFFIAKTAKDLGAKRVGLCTPYLPYMRQDKRFKPGEAITSTYFSSLISDAFDWLVTVDPHLHRRHNLNEIYSIENTVLHATVSITQWISKTISKPLLIGPDSESKQWVESIAHEVDAPYIILEKIRHSDNEVEISQPAIDCYMTHTPVLIDDIISTAQTMIETVKHLSRLGMKPTVCIGVHAIFANNAYQDLLNAGVESVVTCNAIAHQSNKIDLSSLLVEGIQSHLETI